MLETVVALMLTPAGGNREITCRRFTTASIPHGTRDQSTVIRCAVTLPAP
jgi:hypothetical protein